MPLMTFKARPEEKEPVAADKYDVILHIDTCEGPTQLMGVARKENINEIADELRCDAKSQYGELTTIGKIRIAKKDPN